MRSLLQRLSGPRGHTDPVPDGRGRLVVLTDHLWLRDYIGGRAWCDAKRRPCDLCGGKCCDCAHTEQRPDQDGAGS